MSICTTTLLIQPFDVLAFGMPAGGEWLILLLLGLLIFGRRLPEVGRSLGKGIVEFKKGIRGIEDEIDDEVQKPTKRISSDKPRRQELPKAASREEGELEPADAEDDSYASVEERRRED